MFNVFEHPWVLLAVAVVFVFVLILVRTRHWWLWLLPVFIAAAAFGIDHIVQTDTEKIKDVIKTATQAVRQENPDVIEKLISDDYSDSYHDTNKILMFHLRRRLSKPLVEKNVTRIIAIDIQGSDATAVFTVRVIFDKQSYLYQSYKSQAFVKVEMNLEKQLDKSWLISRVELLELDMQPVNWSDIRKHW